MPTETFHPHEVEFFSAIAGIAGTLWAITVSMFQFISVWIARSEEYKNKRNYAQVVILLNSFIAIVTVSDLFLGTLLLSLGEIATRATRRRRIACLRWNPAEAYVLAGLLDEALDAAQEALCINPQELLFRPESFRLRGEILLRDGKPGEAERDFLDAIALAKKMGARRFYDRATCSLRQLLRRPVSFAIRSSSAVSTVG